MKLQPLHYLVIISLLLIFSELLLHHPGVKIGLIAYIFTLLFIFILFIFTKDLPDEYIRVLQMITLIPLYRVITLSIPIDLLTYESYLISTTIAILIGALVLVYRLKLPLADIGLVLNNPLLQILCIVAGGLIGYMEWWVNKPAGFGLLIPTLLILILSAFTDELIFRGLIQQSIEKAEGSPFFAILLTSILYTIFFIPNLNALELLLIFLTSVFYGYIVSRSKSIIGVSISHALVNSCCLMIFPIWL